MVSVTNEVIKGIGHFFSERFPGIHIYDKYTEEGFLLPAVVIQGTTVFAKRRIGGRLKTMNCLMTAKIYGDNFYRLRDMTDEVLLYMDVIETPTLGPVLTRGLDCPYLSDRSATITFTVTMTIDTDPGHKDPLMASLEMKERIVPSEREGL